MRIDDDQVLAAIERLESECATLRRLAGFEPLNAPPEVTASRRPRYECLEPGCARMCRTQDDLDAHRVIDHGLRAGDAA